MLLQVISDLNLEELCRHENLAEKELLSLFRPDENGKIDFLVVSHDSLIYQDSFESLIMTEDGDICIYSFCYVNKELGTAFIEPVCTREKYRGKGLCRQMLYGIINRLKEMRIESVYINSYDWRKKVYNSAGFRTVDSIGFWHRKIAK